MKTNFWSTLSSRKRKLITWLAGLLAFYTLAGFFILPPIIRAVAVKQLSAQLDRKVSIQKVKLNPFVLSVTVRGLLIEDKDGQPFVSWDELYVNFAPWSVFAKAWTFREIRVTAPYARAQMNQDYTFNFSDLIRKFSGTPTHGPPRKPAKPPLVRVKRLIVKNARVSIADFTPRTPFQRVIGPLDLTLNDFQTAPDQRGFYSIVGRTDAGDNFFWRGEFCLDPLRSEGEVIVDNVTLNKFAPLYQDLVQFEIRSGWAGFCADYRFEWSATNHVAAVTNAAFALNNFKLAPAGSTNDLMELYHFAETGVSGDLEAHHGEVGRILVSGGRLFVEREKNQAVNAVEMAAPKQNGEASGAVLLLLRSVTNAVALLLNTTNQWTGIIHEVQFTNCDAHFVDDSTARPATLDLDDFVLEAKNISNVPSTNLTAALSMRWNGNGTIAADMTAWLSPPSADVHVSLDKLDLSTLDPYLESQVNLLVPSGDFGLEGELHVRTPGNGLPEVKFQGDTWLDDFRAVDGVMAQDLLKWDSFRVSGIDANLNPPGVSIKQAALDNASAHLVIETNGAINLLMALQPAVTNEVAAAGPAATAPRPSAPATEGAALSSLPPISISLIVISNAQAAYTDRSLSPNVNLAVERAGGTIAGISSAELQHGEVDLHALVDGAGPVEVAGQINPFSGRLTNELKIVLKNMDLLPASPYSGKFAGYRIARGNLNLDLAYELVGRKLNSQNIITVDQFTFGDKVDSPEATKLPVRLAVAILKDREGKIILNVPIEGSLDDPKFRISKVVVRALVNILTKVATSPFSLLGAAFGGGGEELSYQDFAPGGAALTDESKHKLDVLIKALYNRPGLQLEISGSIAPAGDRLGLQEAAFEKQLRERQWTSLRKSERDTVTPDQIVLTPEERKRLVQELYDEAVNSGQISPAALAANTNLAAIAAQIKFSPKYEKLAVLLEKNPPAGPGTSAAAAPPSPLALPADPEEAMLVAMIPVTDSDFEALAIERARAVRAYLLESGKVETGRLFLTQNRGGGLRQDGSRVYLQLD